MRMQRSCSDGSECRSCFESVENVVSNRAMLSNFSNAKLAASISSVLSCVVAIDSLVGVRESEFAISVCYPCATLPGADTEIEESE